jgi:hypothetical protein
VGPDLIIAIYVNDILIIEKNKAVIQQFKDALKKKFNIKDLGEIQDYLEIEIIKNRAAGTLRISQNKYVKGVLKKYNMKNCNSQTIPIPDGIQIDITDKDYLDKTGHLLYQQIIGSFTYAMQGTRPDITYSVSFCSRFLAKPTKKHMELSKKILRYLKGAPDFGIIYVRHGNNSFSIYTDSNYNERILFNGKDPQAPKRERKATSG